jgi:hypothetical protein
MVSFRHPTNIFLPPIKDLLPNSNNSGLKLHKAHRLRLPQHLSFASAVSSNLNNHSNSNK